ncbi:MAG: AbrB/MazE/SpoVT family DNA-binding domain-containing protein [Verrucomicrobia bacterium]|nr:AbrB/MazE/SpoVT family DNA-binding domain-containing protein [Verrucomicrobiota bacterium]
MKTVVQQWGNSLALRIPKAFAHQTCIKKGSAVSLSVENGRMVVKPIRPRKYSLKELVSRITSQNRHPETDWGKAMGKEIW